MLVGGGWSKTLARIDDLPYATIWAYYFRWHCKYSVLSLNEEIIYVFEGKGETL